MTALELALETAGGGLVGLLLGVVIGAIGLVLLARAGKRGG